MLLHMVYPLIAIWTIRTLKRPFVRVGNHVISDETRRWKGFAADGASAGIVVRMNLLVLLQLLRRFKHLSALFARNFLLWSVTLKRLADGGFERVKPVSGALDFASRIFRHSALRRFFLHPFQESLPLVLVRCQMLPKKPILTKRSRAKVACEWRLDVGMTLHVALQI